MEVRRIRAADTAAYRAMRLRALRAAPDAYGTTLDEASARTEADWGEFVARGAAADDFAMFVLDPGDADPSDGRPRVAQRTGTTRPSVDAATG